jgi:hypothetical protein
MILPRQHEPTRASPDRTPDISVIVPVYEQWDLVPDLLTTLAVQEGAPAFEIILVDNASGEPCRRLPVLPSGTRIVPCAAPGSYAARNAGAAAAAGDWLVFTDADCRPRPGWLAALAEAAEVGGKRLLAGPVELVCSVTEPANPYQTYDRLRGIPQARYVRRGYAATANLAVPAAVFADLGGFDTGRFSGGDAAFCRAAARAGIGITLVAGAVVEHPCRDSWEALAVKARRVKGGQILAGSCRSRLAWALRTLTPPLRATFRFWRGEGSATERRMAIGVLYRLWLVELAEMLRLASGGHPERR